MKEVASGKITVVQEGRFRLVDRHGRCLPFSLAHDADIGPSDLLSLLQSNEFVDVEFEAHAKQIVGVVSKISKSSQYSNKQP